VRSTSCEEGSIAELRLIWLPWHGDTPPFSTAARLQLACLLRRMQRHGCVTLPCSRPRYDLGRGETVYISRVHDPPMDREITYWLRDRAIIILEVLPARPELREPTFLILRRMLDYLARVSDGLLDGGEWVEGDVAGFLHVAPEQAMMLEIRVVLAERFQRLRWDQGWSQVDAAVKLGTSRSRVTRMELPDTGLSIDLFLESLLRLGIPRQELGLLISGLWRPSETAHV
jgi:hypothetical protein